MMKNVEPNFEMCASIEVDGLSERCSGLSGVCFDDTLGLRMVMAHQLSLSGNGPGRPLLLPTVLSEGRFSHDPIDPQEK